MRLKALGLQQCSGNTTSHWSITDSKDFEEFVEHLAVDFNFSALQKACSFGTARILRRVLDTLGWMMQLAIQLKTSYKLNIQD